ncbi:MAG: V-type ATP synthase subunit E family protein [bacterium]
MSLQEDALLLQKVIMHDATTKAEGISAHYRAEALDIEEEGLRTVERLKAQLDDPEFTHNLQRDASKMIADTELNTKIEIEQCKKKLLSDIVSSVEQNLATIRKNICYRDILKNMALEGIDHLGGDNFIIIIAPEDRELIDSGMAQEIMCLTGKHIEIGDPDPSIGHGIIVQKKNTPLIYDNSLKGFIERQKSICYQMANNMLWSQNNQHHAIVVPLHDIKGLRPGSSLTQSNSMCSYSIELGPGLIGKSLLCSQGVSPEREKKWAFTPAVPLNSHIRPGYVFGIVIEKNKFEHRLIVPPGIEGKVIALAHKGEYSLEDDLATIQTPCKEIILKMYHKRYINKPLSTKCQCIRQKLFITGNPYIDIFFPLKKGAFALITGETGSGKTLLSHTICRLCTSDLIVYLSSSNSENEISCIRSSFIKNTTKPAILLCNEENETIGVKRASIDIGFTLCEYYRDMGYDVLFVIDSISHILQSIEKIDSSLDQMGEKDVCALSWNTQWNKIIKRSGMIDTPSGPRGSISTIVCVQKGQRELFPDPMNSIESAIGCRWHVIDKKICVSKSYSNAARIPHPSPYRLRPYGDPSFEALRILFEYELMTTDNCGLNLSKRQRRKVETAIAIRETFDTLAGASLQKQLYALKGILDNNKKNKIPKKDEIKALSDPFKEKNFRNY